MMYPETYAAVAFAEPAAVTFTCWLAVVGRQISALSAGPDVVAVDATVYAPGTRRDSVCDDVTCRE